MSVYELCVFISWLFIKNISLQNPLSDWKHQAKSSPFPHKESQKPSEVLCFVTHSMVPHMAYIHIGGRDTGPNFYFSTVISERIPL